MLNIFLNDGGKVNEEAISLLSPMCKDEEIKGILSGLIGKDLVKKLAGQRNDIKSADVVNVLYEDKVVKEIFSEKNKEHIIDLLKKQDGLYNVDINFNENGQIKEVKREKLEKFFDGNELNLKALKEQAIVDFVRDLKSIKTDNYTINAKEDLMKNKKFFEDAKISEDVKKLKSLEKSFENAKINKDTEDLIYKFPGQSAYDTSSSLVGPGTAHLSYVLFCENIQGTKLNSCGITVNDNESVEVKVRRIGIISTGPLKLPMAIEEVHTFKIKKGDDRYKTTNAKITVYRLKSTDIQLTEGETHIKLTKEDLKDRNVLSEVKYNGDEDK